MSLSNKQQHPKFKFLEHPADIKLQAFGTDLPELFINAALGMMEFLFGEAQQQQKVREKKTSSKTMRKEIITVDGDNLEMLLVNWLSEILFLSNVNKCRYVEYQMHEFTEHKIVAEIAGFNAVAEDDIKAVTYNELAIQKTPRGWEAIAVFDI